MKLNNDHGLTLLADLCKIVGEVGVASHHSIISLCKVDLLKIVEICL